MFSALDLDQRHMPERSISTAQLSTELDIWNDRLRLEDHTVVVRAGLGWLQLFGEERHVVRQSKKVLLVSFRAGLTRHGEPAISVLVAQGAKPFDREDVVARDAVVEDHTPIHLKLIRSLGQVAGSHVGIRATRGATVAVIEVISFFIVVPFLIALAPAKAGRIET